MSHSPAPVSRRRLLSGAAVGSLAAGLVGAGAEAAASTPARPGPVHLVEHPGRNADETSIQSALNAVRDTGGGQVVVAPGTWEVARTPLRIYANTRLTLTPATTLVRTGPVTALLSNGPRDGSDTTTKGYTGPGNIVVEGGRWDANGDSIRSASWGIVFAHARDIVVRDLEILNIPDWHAVELNSTFNGTVENCRFQHYVNIDEPAWNAEAVSIDLAMTGLPPFGDDDNTPSQLIRVIGNFCQDWYTFAGCHSAVASTYHDQIVIAGNTVRDLAWWGVDLKNASHSIVIGNTMVNVGGGIWVRSDTAADRTRPVTDVVISDNIIETMTVDEGIRLAGTVSGDTDGRIYNASVTGNIIRTARNNGILAQWCSDLRLADNQVDTSNGTGIRVENSERTMITSNRTQSTQTEGILISGGTNHQVSGNSVTDAALSAGGHNAVQLNSTTSLNVQGNKITSTDVKPAHAIGADSFCAGVFYTNNDVRDGYADAPFNLAGTGHRDQPGNAS